MMLSPMQKDVLTEIINVHIGLAAKSLSEMINQRVLLSVPEIEFIQHSDTDVFDRIHHEFLMGEKVICSIKFGPDFVGKVFLVLPIENAKILSNACIGINEVKERESQSFSLNEMDLDIIKEVSNVIFNVLIGEFGNLLETKLKYTIPNINTLTISESDKYLLFPKEVNALILHTKFLFTNSQLSSTILIALFGDSISLLIDKIDTMLEDLT
ncbi:chemotaxis protein CheC [Maledivibacter halophilus]|uniref:Chemotaxis protein CheC n=2 Tax=Maledivibacter halophilus TaxID=36842 RepID=A0A1T5IAA6_9FIRM|nr:chemotaxis protein CheC [Maledivibacter halophilus]